MATDASYEANQLGVFTPANEAREALERVQRDTDTLGSSALARMGRRAGDHFGARDAMDAEGGTDPIELWGRRIGRILSLIGVIILARTKVEPFDGRQVDLVTTFADQASQTLGRTSVVPVWWSSRSRVARAGRPEVAVSMSSRLPRRSRRA